MCKFLAFIWLSILVAVIQKGHTAVVNEAEWNAYKATFQKNYATPLLENTARNNYVYNKAYIDSHNAYADINYYTYRLKPSPFSDILLANYVTLFPKVTYGQLSYDSPPPPALGSSLTEFDLFESFGVPTIAEDQGIVCNSGWAYATAKAIELLKHQQDPSTPRLSAQSLIDCSGLGRGCLNQVPQTAFDYLTLYSQVVYRATDYPANISRSVQGICEYPSNGAVNPTRIAQYSKILDNYDEVLRLYVSAGYPVIIEIDPSSFEFMHYAEGVFQQPATYKGSHFVVVIGYGIDSTTNLPYWTLLNSFGPNWGIDGKMRILRDTAKSITKSAIFPTMLK